ncbi:MAG: aldo/keto reductase [Firmicutes bacterium]|nr:aldo/keto reductase [Bacillota bacterium]
MHEQMFNELRLSALGFGAMRLPTIGGAPGAGVDETEAKRMIAYAYEHGVNYFDTAYPYHNGESEIVLGNALRQFPRDSYYIATKYPGHEIHVSYDPKATFEEQLAKCGMEYFDFYLLHNVYENSLKTYADSKWGIFEYFREQKRIGRIRHFGFSTHGDAKTIREFLDVYGGEMEFCQIQLNYLDWTLQDAKSKYDLLTERGIPVWVMEPVRGGKLASLTPENLARLKAKRPDESAAAWAFRWLQTLPNVQMILSGMSTMEQVRDNIKTFSTTNPLNADEVNLLAEVAASMLDLLPCTACRYCCDECPQQLDIPTLLTYYNDCRFAPSFMQGMKVDALEPEKRPAACIACGQCKEICPQGIDIPEALQAFQGILDTLPHWADMRQRPEDLAQRQKAGQPGQDVN